MYRRQALLLLVLCALSNGSAAYDNCQNIPPPLLSIDAPIGMFKMQRVPGLKVAAAVHDKSGNKVSGATFFYPRTELAVEVGENAGCVTIQAVRLQLADPSPYFWIAEELPSGSCIEMELIAHENKHVEVYRQVYATFPARAAPLIQALTARYPQPASGGPLALIHSNLDADINDALTPLLDNLADEADARNRAIDNPAEYERIRASCGGSLNDYLR